MCRLGGLCGDGHVQPKELGEILASEIPCGSLLRAWQRRAGAGYQFLFVHSAKPKEELGLLVQASADAIENSRNMLAHLRPVRATARQLDLFGRRKKPGLLPADAFHHAL